MDKNEGKAYIHVGSLAVAIKRNKIGKGKRMTGKLI